MVKFYFELRRVTLFMLNRYTVNEWVRMVYEIDKCLLHINELWFCSVEYKNQHVFGRVMT